MEKYNNSKECFEEYQKAIKFCCLRGRFLTESDIILMSKRDRENGLLTPEMIEKLVEYAEKYKQMYIKDEPEVTPIYNGELGKYPPKRPKSPKSLERDYDER